MDKINPLLDESIRIVESLSDIKDPYKMKEVFMKKEMPHGHISDVVRIREHAAVELFGGGAIEVHSEMKEVNISNFLKRGFIPCKKEEYDQVAVRAVREINALV